MRSAGHFILPFELRVHNNNIMLKNTNRVVAVSGALSLAHLSWARTGQRTFFIVSFYDDVVSCRASSSVENKSRRPLSLFS